MLSPTLDRELCRWFTLHHYACMSTGYSTSSRLYCGFGLKYVYYLLSLMFVVSSMAKLAASRVITLGSVLGLAAKRRNISRLSDSAAASADDADNPASEFMVMVT
mmetsp:Transcript_28821/g.54463  ORF Transcript_28821/g.54463 Transcript_28821/m.54463 type:complete len:105 (-) Transcript_28821:44-358(-)